MRARSARADALQTRTRDVPVTRTMVSLPERSVTCCEWVRGWYGGRQRAVRDGFTGNLRLGFGSRPKALGRAGVRRGARDTHHERVVERREDVRDTEHVLALAGVGHVGLDFLHDGGSHRFFRVSLRRMRNARGQWSPGSGDGDARRGEREARVRARSIAMTRRGKRTHHDVSVVSAAASERTEKRARRSLRRRSSRLAMRLLGKMVPPIPAGIGEN